MKIAISTAVYYPMTNGVAVFSHNLAKGLAARGHEVLVLCPSRTGKNYTVEEDGVTVTCLRSTKIHVYPDQINPVPPKHKVFGKEMPHLLYKKSFRVSVLPANQVKKALNAFQPDVIHCQVSDLIGLTVVSYARHNNIPLVTTEHNFPEVITDPLKIPRIMKKPANAALAAYFVSRQRRSDYVTMPTQLAINDLILSRKKEFNVPVEAVSNGVDLSTFRPGKADEVLYSKYEIPTDRPIVLYVGRVDPEKKIGTVMEAFAKTISDAAAGSTLSRAFLLVIGDGVDRLRLEKYAKELGISDSCKFLGRVMPPDLFELYRVGTLFVTASEIETQGIVLIEAAATGLPLIAVDKGAVGEVCRTGENGFLCEPGDVDGIADGMKQILSDPELCRRFSEKSIEIASHHDMDNTLKRFEEIYQEVIEKKHTNSTKK